MSMTINADLTDLNKLLGKLGQEAEEIVRPVAQAGAQVIYDQVKLNVSKLGRKTGNLDSAIYQAFSAKNSGTGHATYHISWNAKKAPHGNLVEHGHIQRYASYIGSDGKWYTAIRPEMQGKKKPRRRASQAEKDAYYVPRKGGAIQIPAQSFVRNAASRIPDAITAATNEFIKIFEKGGQ